MKTFKKMTKNKVFWVLISVIFILHIITYPSIHHIIDEKTFLDIGRNVCNLNFSDFFGKKPPEYFSHNTPLYNIILCLTSPLHGFNVERAELVTFSFLIAMVIGWYVSIPDQWKVDKKRFVLLLFSNSLLWVYSFRILMDIPLAFFLSLGMLNLYLFYEMKKRKNYYLGFLFLSLALFVKESALIFLPIFIIYFLIRREKNIKNWVLLFLPFIPFIVFTFIQYLSGFPVLREFVDIAFKPTTKVYEPDKERLDYSTIPYARFPTILFITGIFGPGIISLILMWNSIRKGGGTIKSFLIFTLILYILWELIYDFAIFANMPRYHTTLIPFLSLIISEASKKNKVLKYIYFLTLVYSLIIGFLAAYYFHVQTLEIWKLFLSAFRR